MVEIHEPVRLLFIVETTPQALAQILERQPGIGTICRNSWMQLATLDPDSSEIRVFRNGEFQPYKRETDRLPQAQSSLECYRGRRHHLGFAEIFESVVADLPVETGEQSARN
jgi:hypothetical protein